MPKLTPRQRIKKIISVIEALDAFRIGTVSNIELLGLTYRELNLGTRARKWKDLKKDLEAIALLAVKNPKINKLIRRDKKLNEIYKILLITMLFTAFVTPLIAADINPQLLYYILLALLTAVNVVLIYRLHILDKITLFYINNKDKYQEQSERLRQDINNLIRELRKELKKAKLPPTIAKIKLYHTDYEKIKIIKQPGRFRKYYIAVPEI